MILSEKQASRTQQLCITKPTYFIKAEKRENTNPTEKNMYKVPLAISHTSWCNWWVVFYF